MDFILNVLINIIAFVCFLVGGNAIKKEKQLMGKVIASLSIAGLAIVGTGLILSGVEELHTYMYIILVIEMGILFINVFMNYLSKLGKSEVLIGVCVLILTIFNLFTYVTYVVLTFVFY
ncbi:hypothetical protein ACOUWG_001487 [Listeria monocytogenes]|uniref:hypothetical protein n=1 Tax=Listeria monocytogenes TaxID=1639 RepID=UPI0010E071B5|nr:hypothetical protein [Listeria monocytogenes]EAE0011787.1 hypothetical protein [Listeria monocytogenes]EKG2418416.1 hypothetical protein [Listeria monocytogenes]